MSCPGLLCSFVNNAHLLSSTWQVLLRAPPERPSFPLHGHHRAYLHQSPHCVLFPPHRGALFLSRNSRHDPVDKVIGSRHGCTTCLNPRQNCIRLFICMSCDPWGFQKWPPGSLRHMIKLLSHVGATTYQSLLSPFPSCMYRRQGDGVSSRGHRDGVARNLILGIIVIMKQSTLSTFLRTQAQSVRGIRLESIIDPRVKASSSTVWSGAFWNTY